MSVPCLLKHVKRTCDRDKIASTHYALEHKVFLLMITISLSLVRGPNPRRGLRSASGYGPWGPYLLANLDRGVHIC